VFATQFQGFYYHSYVDLLQVDSPPLSLVEELLALWKLCCVSLLALGFDSPNAGGHFLKHEGVPRPGPALEWPSPVPYSCGSVLFPVQQIFFGQLGSWLSQHSNALATQLNPGLQILNLGFPRSFFSSLLGSHVILLVLQAVVGCP
jgi:hypothetical protein